MTEKESIMQHGLPPRLRRLLHRSLDIERAARHAARQARGKLAARTF